MLSRRHLLVVAMVATATSLGWIAPARAQSPNEAAATALFDEGRRLMAENHYAEACPKLAESERLAPSGGTLINLADCYEHAGLTASAWVAWKDAAARANAAGKGDIEKLALSKAAALEQVLPRLTIALDAAGSVAGLEVKRDGVVVGQAELGVAIPVDPGSHLVEATAPQKKPFSTRIDVAAGQTDARVVLTLESVPASAPPPVPVQLAPSSPAAPTVPPAVTSAGSGLGVQKTLGLAAGIVGLGGLVVGSIFGLEAKSKNDQALEPQNCRTSTLCTQTGLDLTSDARNAATISTVSFVAGGALVAAGAVLWLTAPSSAHQGLRLAPMLTTGAGGLVLDGRW